MTANAATESFSSDLAAAVRAEFGRQGKRALELTRVLDMTPPTAYGRFNGRTPFTAEELDKVAMFLDLSAYDLIASAELASRFQGSRQAASDAAPALEASTDSMAQPERSKRRRKGDF